MSLSHAIMTALMDRQLTGYDLAKQFDVSLGFFWSASHQQIYQQLKTLTAASYVAVTEVAQSGKPDKRLYELTESGRSALIDWVAGETKRKPARDDLFVKLYNMGVVDGALLLKQILERQTEHQQRLALYQRIRERGYQQPGKLDQHQQGRFLALLAGIYQERAALQWCDEAILLMQSSADN